MQPTDLAAALSPTAQAARQADYLADCRAASFPRFAADGSWVGPGDTPGFRERMWHCLALLPGDPVHVALANRILETSDDSAGDFTCYFTTLLLRLHRDRLTPAAADLLWQRACAHVDHVWDHIYRYTENCAALNVFALWEYATATGERKYADRAAERLEVFSEERRHNGASQEFVSINYLPVFLTGMAAVARWCPEPDYAALAAALEEKLWRELAVCWHPLLRFSIGPSGRSYTNCSLGLAKTLDGIVWVTLGEQAAASPRDRGVFSVPPPLPGEGAGGGESRPGLTSAIDPPFLQSEIVALAATVPYRITPETAALFFEKRYPNRMAASVTLPAYRENDPAPAGVDVQALGGWWADATRGYLPGTVFHPGGRAVLSTYMTETYGVGASTRLLGSQCDFLHALWRSASEPPPLQGEGAGGEASAAAAEASLSSRRPLWLRYVVNDQPEQKLGGGQLDLVHEQGRGGALQSGPLAVAWYAGGEVIREGLTQLRTCALLGEFFNPVGELWIGETPCPDLTGTSVEEDWVFLHDGPTYAALRPLRLTNHGRAHAVTVAPLGPTRLVSFYNYAGPPRDFLGAELRQTCGGLILLLGSTSEYPDFAAFRAACRTLELTDYTYESERRIIATWGDHQVDILWDMQTEGLLRAKRNGQFIGEPYSEYEEG